jgi:hypothetical protein
LDFLPIQAPLATAVDALGLCPLNSLALPLLDETPFHLSDHPKHGQHDASRLAACGDVRVKHGHEGLALIAFMHDIEHVTRIAPEPVQTRDHQLITRAEKLDDDLEFRSAIATRAGDFLRAKPQPSACSRSSWASRSWSAVLTRA